MQWTSWSCCPIYVTSRGEPCSRLHWASGWTSHCTVVWHWWNMVPVVALGAKYQLVAFLPDTFDAVHDNLFVWVFVWALFEVCVWRRRWFVSRWRWAVEDNLYLLPGWRIADLSFCCGIKGSPYISRCGRSWKWGTEIGEMESIVNKYTVRMRCNRRSANMYLDILRWAAMY